VIPKSKEKEKQEEPLFVNIVISRSTKKQKEVQMDHIRLENREEEGLVFDVGELMARLEQLTDRRKARGKRYSLPFLLTAILLAKLAGEDTPKGIADWLKLRRQQIVAAFKLKRTSVPAYNTIRRTLAGTLSAKELQRSLRQFLHQSYGGQQSILVVIDGKTLRGTIPKGKTQGVHLLAAYLPEEGLALLQVAVESKENEITAAPRLLTELDLKGRIVCGDAMFTQRHLSVQVVAQGGDYIWFVKDNQKQLGGDVEQFFVPPRQAKGWHMPQLPRTVAHKVEKAHGRLEHRTLTLMSDETSFVDWPALEQVFKLDRKVTCCRTGVVTEETVYGITSLFPEQVTAEQMLAWTRAYWGIENGLHYRRDTTLREDATRMSSEIQAQVIATLNNFVIGLVNKLRFSNLASARRHFDAQLNLKLAAFT
jgi:predicted transposase YbfD/YdcC